MFCTQAWIPDYLNVMLNYADIFRWEVRFEPEIMGRDMFDFPKEQSLGEGDEKNSYKQTTFAFYLFSSFALSCSSCLRTWTITDSNTPVVKPAKLRGVERRLVEAQAAPFSSSSP